MDLSTEEKHIRLKFINSLITVKREYKASMEQLAKNKATLRPRPVGENSNNDARDINQPKSSFLIKQGINTKPNNIGGSSNEKLTINTVEQITAGGKKLESKSQVAEEIKLDI